MAKKHMQSYYLKVEVTYLVTCSAASSCQGSIALKVGAPTIYVRDHEVNDRETS